MTDADRTQMQQWVINPLLRLRMTDADRTKLYVGVSMTWSLGTTEKNV